MNNQVITLYSVIGFIAGALLIKFGALVFRSLTIVVEDEYEVLVTRFGKLARRYQTPGLYFFPEKLLPWIKVTHVSMQRDFRHYRDIHLNDNKGTTLIVELWLELKISDTEKAYFGIESWEEALKSLITHAATSILGSRDFIEILCDRSTLGELLCADIREESKRWGVDIQTIFIRKVSLLPEVSRQMFEAVAARLERAKADVEEEGRLRVAELEAKTSVRVASLVGMAKGQYPAAVGRAYALMGSDPEVLAAYQQLYTLSTVRPHRTYAFTGFEGSEMRSVDALMAVQMGNPQPVGNLSSSDVVEH